VSIGLANNWKSIAAAAARAVVVVAAVMATTGPGCRSAVAAETAAPVRGKDLVRAHCSGCHQEHAGEFDRINAMRKTPEGWVMTLARMHQVHGLILDDEVRDAIVRYLADTQGLAPTESAGGRFALERRPNAQDIDLGPQIGVMCGRCHSLARVALQRRDEAEWRKLAHTHVGQWPSLEYQASGRDRPWWQVASGPQPAQLAALYPFASTAWSDWKARPIRDLSGTWVVVGHVPGGNDFYGSSSIHRAPNGDFTASYRLSDVTGFEFSGESKAIVYTGYEWRGSAELHGRSMREVYAVSEDGNRIAGRWFDAEHAEDGGDWIAVRESEPGSGSTPGSASGSPQIVAVLPQAVRAGTSSLVTIVGLGFGAAPPPSFGEGIVASNVQRQPNSIRALVTVAADAAPGLRTASVGGAAAKFSVYRRIDQIDVLPKYAIARLGGGRVDPVAAQFEAVGLTRLPSGELLSIGPVRAEWTTIPFNAEARRTEDEKYAGHFDPRGRFNPSAAGPNPAREFTGDNVGNLTVVAQADDGGRKVEGRSHLVVTVQRWITPPIY
jgi:quinohemoprotein amine dehydrogenase